MSNREKLNRSIDTAEEVARKIWLAGLGAYGKSFEEIQGQYEKLNTQGTRLFEDLVTKGATLEAGTKEKVKEKTSVEKRVDEVRKMLGLDTSDTDAKIEELAQKVDALTIAISKLTKAH